MIHGETAGAHARARQGGADRLAASAARSRCRRRSAQPIEGTYARRLLHRDPSGHYTMVVMTWGPGQKTALHDHAGIWCVECVVDGNMEVAQYDLMSESDGASASSSATGSSPAAARPGCLIPPFEYHTLGNAADEAVGDAARLRRRDGSLPRLRAVRRRLVPPRAQRIWRITSSSSRLRLPAPGSRPVAGSSAISCPTGSSANARSSTSTIAFAADGTATLPLTMSRAAIWLP